jgi:hypothetical protein
VASIKYRAEIVMNDATIRLRMREIKGALHGLNFIPPAIFFIQPSQNDARHIEASKVRVSWVSRG